MIANNSIQQHTVCLCLCCRSLLSLCLVSMSMFTVCFVSVSNLCLPLSLVDLWGLDGVVMVAVGGRWRVAGAWLRCVCLCVCVRVCVCLCACLLCGAVSCPVSRVVARYFLFVVGHLSSVVGCPSVCCALLFCVVACCCCCCCGLLLVIGVSAYAFCVALVLLYLLVACVRRVGRVMRLAVCELS